MRPLAFLFLSIVLVKALVPAMDTTELAKLPALLEHYHEHQALQPYLSFVEFLSLHFSEHKHRREDPARHSRLPFSHHHYQSAFSLWYVDAVLFDLCQGALQRCSHFTTVESGTFFLLATDIWQPPRQ